MDDKAVAQAIDRAIHTQYRLWPGNYIAYDQCYDETKYANQYTPSERENFLARFSTLKPEIRKLVYQIYANPVISWEKVSDELAYASPQSGHQAGG